MAEIDNDGIVVLVAILLGVWNCVAILVGSATALIAGMWQILAAFGVLCCEAPCCCMFVDHVQRLSEWVDKRPYWNRALGYVMYGVILSGVFCIVIALFVEYLFRRLF